MPWVDIDTFYEHILEDIRAGKRPTLSLTQGDFSSIRTCWEKALEVSDLSALEKILCVLGHSAELSDDFDGFFVQTLEYPFGRNEKSRFIVLTLAASWKHIVDRSHKKGERIDARFIEALRKLLHGDNLEILEWVLRTIDQIGPQAIFFKNDIMEIKMGPTRLLSAQKRKIHRMITFLSRKWRPS